MKKNNNYKMRHYLPPTISGTCVKNIMLVGAGGTGSQILTDLARMNHALIALGYSGLHVVTTDPDRVSETNVGRQLYSMSDVGMYKAVVLTTRLNAFFGTAWKAFPAVLTKSAGIQKNEFDIIITAVDNVRARKAAHRVAETANIPYWLDTGNMAKTGNVIFGNAGGFFSKQPTKKGCIERLPNAIDLYGDVLLSAANEAIQPPSCSMEASLTKQDLFINKAVSTFAMQILWNCFRKGYIEHHGAFINLDTMNVRALDVNPETWKNMGWIQKKPSRRKYAR